MALLLGLQPACIAKGDKNYIFGVMPLFNLDFFVKIAY